MSDVKDKKIKVMLDKEREFIFDMDSVEFLQEKYGSPLKAVMQFSALSSNNETLLTKEHTDLFFDLIHALLLHYEEGFDLKAIRKAVGSPYKIGEISQKITAAIMSGSPEGDEAEQGDPT